MKDNTAWMNRIFTELRGRALKGGLELQRTRCEQGQEYRPSYIGTTTVAYADPRLDNCRGWLAYRPDLQGQHEASTAA